MPFDRGSWDGSESRWASADDYCASSLIDENPAGQPKTKALCKLPVRNPGRGSYSIPAMQAAFAALRGGRGGVQASEDSKRKAMDRLMRLYSEAGLEKPADTSLRSGEEEVVEQRSAALVDLDASEDGSEFRGYAAVFDSPTEFELQDGTTIVESIERGAFRKILAEGRNVPMLWDHQHAWPLATTRAGTLKLAEDPKGLRVEAHIGDDFMSNFVRARVQRGEVSGMSYGFVAGPGNQRFSNRDGKTLRKLTGFRRLLDVSPTWDPANQQTAAELRRLSMLAHDLQVQDLNDLQDLSGEPAMGDDLSQLGDSQLEGDGLDIDAGAVVSVNRRSWRQTIAHLS